MDNKMICCKCKKRPAVIFVSKIEGEKTSQEGFCIKCAMDLNIGPIKQMMESMGITDDELEAVSEQFGDMLGDMDGFQPGGAGTMPFLQNLFNSDGAKSSKKDENADIEEDIPETEELIVAEEVISDEENLDDVEEEINKIANMLHLTSNDIVAVSDLDHHSARLPFVMSGAGVVICPLDENNDIDINQIPFADVVLVTAMSNVLGWGQNVADIVIM